MIHSTIELFHTLLLPEMEEAALEVLRSGQISNGGQVAAFEYSFAQAVARKHIVSTSDLTSSLILALQMAGVRPGDEVATVSFSCLQSTSSITRVGAFPVWIDIDPMSMSMSIDDLESKLSPRIKCVMVYHIAGYPSDAARIADLCHRRGIPLIEDCNNAIGATLNGQQVGVYGDYAVYSIYPNRQINGIDGGMLATPDVAIAARVTRLRRFGVDAATFRDARGEINPDSDVPEIGWPFPLSNLNAAVALSQLNTLSNRSKRTRDAAEKLASSLSGLRRLRLVRPIPGATSAFWGFLVLAEHRDALLGHLKAHGIKTSILHQRNDWYTGFDRIRADLPGTELVTNQLLALPCGYWLTNTQLNELICKVIEFDSFPQLSGIHNSAVEPN